MRYNYSGLKFKNLFVGALCMIMIMIFVQCTPISKDKIIRSHIEQPNVLFISIDDLNDWAQPLAGNHQSLTPNLDHFARQSVSFTRNYCTSPGCNPSRSTLLAGLHTFNSGMYSNYQDWRKVPGLRKGPTLPHYFKQNGYFTAGAGKIFHYGQVDTLAWDAYYPSITRPMPDEAFPDTTPANMPPFKYMYNMFDWAPLDIQDSQMGDHQSISFIIDQLYQDHEHPFFLACGIYRPHLPWYVPQKYFDLFPLDRIQLPKLISDDTSDLGLRAKEIIHRGGNYHKHVLASNQWKKAIQGYLASIAYADQAVGELLNALKESTYAENTIVVIWSDHGWQLGEKTHWRKFALWENVIRTLLLIKVPQNVAAMDGKPTSGISTVSLTSLLDLYPTLIDLCQLPPRSDLDGQSLIPLLLNPDSSIVRPILTTYDFGDYSVRYKDWHYIKYIDESEELYKLREDPEEWYNLAYDPSYRTIIDSLQGFFPHNPVPLPVTSLLELQEHHVPPIRSTEYYFSQERKDWMQRFK